MANPRIRILLALTTFLVLSLADTTEAREADCSDVVSPISGTTFRGLIRRAKDLGATKADLYLLVQRSRCRSYLEQLIESTFKEP